MQLGRKARITYMVVMMGGSRQDDDQDFIIYRDVYALLMELNS